MEDTEGEELPAENLNFNDPVHKELVVINGKINGMDRNQLITNLKRLHLLTSGSAAVMRRRLKNHYRVEKLSSANLLTVSKLYPYYVVVDFEATCNTINPPNFPHEIIEFPAILVDSVEKRIVGEFHSYVKPTLNPKLTKFCIELTGITQDTVDESEEFPQVLVEFELWLRKHELGTKHKYAIVTDGPWDMGRFLVGQCKISNIQFPPFAKKWINIRKTYSNFYRCRRMTLQQMLDQLGIKFIGRPHCGLDDSRNIATVLLYMIKDGVSLEINEYISHFRNLNRHTNSQAKDLNRIYEQRYLRGQQLLDNQQQQNKDRKPEPLENVEDIEFALSLLSVQKEGDVDLIVNNKITNRVQPMAAHKASVDLPGS